MKELLFALMQTCERGYKPRPAHGNYPLRVGVCNPDPT